MPPRCPSRDASRHPDRNRPCPAEAVPAASTDSPTDGGADLLTLVYEELRRLAASKLAREAPGHTLQPTALVHEAWLRLMGSQPRQFQNRAHFFSAAAEAMRRILIDRARRKLAVRHGGSLERVALPEESLVANGTDEQLLAVHEVVDSLAAAHPAQAEVVKLRYFAGMTNEETAAALGVSVATVKNYWTFARTWIFQALRRSASQDREIDAP